MTIELNQFSDISRRLDELHDCPFDLDLAHFDPATHEWQGRFLRPVWEGPDVQSQRHALVVSESRLPVVEARLRLRSVTEVRILDDQRIGRYTFNRVERFRDGLRLHFNERMRIELACGGAPAGSYEEVPVKEIRAVYRSVLFLLTGPTLEFAPGSFSEWAA